MSFAENVKKYRQARKMTQEQLANGVGVSSRAVSKWERGICYPDVSLLVPLAELLNVSLDQLFDHKPVSMQDLSERILRVVLRTPSESRMELVREMGWQMQKALFTSFSEFAATPYHENEFGEDTFLSCVETDYGFAQMHNGKCSFFGVFPEPKGGWGEMIGDGEELRTLFECLADKDTMKALIFLYHCEDKRLFESEALGRDCGISPEAVESVILKLKELDLITEVILNIDNEVHRLYRFEQTHWLLSLFLVTNAKNSKNKRLWCALREKPYFR